MTTYPPFLIPLVLVIGVILALRSPFAAFIFAAFGLAALDFKAATFTRTIFGPYVNLADAFVIVLIIAYGWEAVRLRKRFPAPPRIFTLLLIIWGVGLVVGLATLGPIYELTREARWSLNFILCLLFAFLFVSTPHRARWVVIALFAAAVAAAIQHLLFVRQLGPGNLASMDAQLNSLRTIGFMFSPISYFLIVALVLPFQVVRTWPAKVQVVWWLGISLFLASVLLNQTRSQWITIALSAPVVAVLLGKPLRIIRIYAVMAVVLTVVALIVPLVVPSINPFEMISSRLAFLTNSAARESASYERMNQIRVELKLWFDGGFLTWWMGQGFAFNYQDRIVWLYGSGPADGANVAWGHVGYVTYVARIGIVGFFVYAFLVPFVGLRSGLRNYRNAHNSWILLLSLLALSVTIADVIQFAMSGSYLQPELSVSGLVIGASLGYARRAAPSGIKIRNSLQPSAPQQLENVAAHM